MGLTITASLSARNALNCSASAVNRFSASRPIRGRNFSKKAFLSLKMAASVRLFTRFTKAADRTRVRYVERSASFRS